ncbi:mannitol dehydrogenase family protein [Microbulbifer thermotolerans]|uniref:mannitol dehydrogenase family protein n=1 Tax=Microbulbifer thermotolerans TaxID=252514 RepID=UPI0022496216|nr:mannitol dehydrogenase family protein [Microbulbifer thermotolerans]MCX2832176.1 mannitol dehydrogenase family protein [Microbulbifer thermotolerans]
MSKKLLNRHTLNLLPDSVTIPDYDRNTIRAGIVHLGIGAFHRAHQAWYTEQLLVEGASEWGIIAASLRSPAVRDQLAPQDYLYSVVEKSNTGEKVRVIGCVQHVYVAPENPGALLEAMTDGEIRIVSLTITEKGYCHDPASGTLNLQHPDIQHDLANPQSPKSALGFIVYALQARMDKGLPGFTLLSCDNLPANGKLLQRVLFEFAEQVDPDLASWIKVNTRCPSTMIDRIVPATTDTDREALENMLGLRDNAAVVAEPFSQWVIEDNFLRGRPDWDRAGATFVEDVEPYELIKLRLLNGCHSLLAYSGYLAGFETIADVMAEPAFAALAQHFLATEAGTAVEAPRGFDLEKYRQQLLERFSNRALRHRTWQIAMDGSQKIPQRWLGTLRHQLANGGPIDLLSFTLACWIRYVSAVDDAGNTIEVSDPLAADLKALCDRHADDTSELTAAFLQFSAVFGADLRQSERLHSALSGWLTRLKQHGVLTCVRTQFEKSPA